MDRASLSVLLFGGAGLLFAASKASETPVKVSDTLSLTNTSVAPSYIDRLYNDVIPRGIRNNNPGNIENRENWEGKIGDDGRFIIFRSPEFGIRAIARIFRSYQKRGVVTIEQIIETWAPPFVNGKFENDTQAYIRSVETSSGFSRGTIVDGASVKEVIAGIILQENGSQPYPLSVIQKGIDLA